jgi:hypothetical protein
MFVFAFKREAGIHPVLLASGVILHVCVTEFRQFTGGLFRRRSAWLRAIDHDFRVLVGKKPRRKFGHLVRREIDRSRQMSVLERGLWQNFDKCERIAAIHFLFQRIS